MRGAFPELNARKDIRIEGRNVACHVEFVATPPTPTLSPH